MSGQPIPDDVAKFLSNGADQRPAGWLRYAAWLDRQGRHAHAEEVRLFLGQDRRCAVCGAAEGTVTTLSRTLHDGRPAHPTGWCDKDHPYGPHEPERGAAP